MSNLPKQESRRGSDNDVRNFFDKYFTKKLSFPSNEIDAVIAFFQKRGFDEAAAVAVANVILQQTKIDNINVFKVLDTLKGLEKIQLSAVVTEVLNYNRDSTSTLGFKRDSDTSKLERRNILD